MSAEPIVFVPARGMVNSEALKVDEAIREYDERLVFGRHEQTRDWCIFIKLPRSAADDGYPLLDGAPVYPLMGFQRIPAPHEAIARLQKADTLRSGENVLDKITKQNLTLQDDRWEEINTEAAERIEHEMRRRGIRDQRHFFIKGGK